MEKLSTVKDTNTELQIDFFNNRGILRIKSSNNDILKSTKTQHKQILLKLKCKPSIETLILHDFKSTYLNQKCLKSNEITILKVNLCVCTSQQFPKQKQNFIEKIECQSSHHTTYILALIRSIWQYKINTQNKNLKLQDIIQACKLYISQFQLQINDLIQIFEAPLTTQYSRL